MRRQGNYPPQGGGGTPLQGEQPQRFLNSGNFAWNMNGAMPAPEPAAAEVRLLDIWMSPHGFIKAAMEADDATATQSMLEGRPMTVVSFTAMDKYRVNGTINAENLVDRTQTWIANPVLGDTIFDHRYSEYKDFGGVKFPTVLHSHQGDPRLNAGHNWKEVRVTTARANVDAPRLTVPDTVREASVPAVPGGVDPIGQRRVANRRRNASQRGRRVQRFRRGRGSALNEARSLAVIAETRRLIPNKPIRYLVNTHHHFDHSGGPEDLCSAERDGGSHQARPRVYDDVVPSPSRRTVEPDILSNEMPVVRGKQSSIIRDGEYAYVISDGARTLDVYPVLGLAHSGSMLMVYLPTEKILINADWYSPPALGAQAPVANASMRSLYQNIQRLNLPVERHVGIDGRLHRTRTSCVSWGEAEQRDLRRGAGDGRTSRRHAGDRD